MQLPMLIINAYSLTFNVNASNKSVRVFSNNENKLVENVQPTSAVLKQQIAGIRYQISEQSKILLIYNIFLEQIFIILEWTGRSIQNSAKRLT